MLIENSQYIIISIILSVLFIGGIHYSYNYLKDMFTIKRTKNLVEYQTQKYKSVLVDFMNNPNLCSQDYLNSSEKEKMVENLDVFVDKITSIL